jgi:hypothetical protein
MGELRRVADFLLDAVESLEAAQSGEAPARGFHTGLSAVDALEPWRTSRLTIVTGRASVGKTGLVLRAAWESARRSLATAVFTGDGTGASMAARLLIAAADIRVPRGVPGSFTRENWARVTEVSHKLSQLPLWIRELRPYEPDAVRSAFEDATALVRPALSVFDGIPWSRAAIVSTLYDLAEERRVPVLAGVRDDGEMFAPRTLEPLRFAAPRWTTVLQLARVAEGPEPDRADLALTVCDNDGHEYESVPLVLDKPVAWVREVRRDERPPVRR